jgi:hypothetical protein
MNLVWAFLPYISFVLLTQFSVSLALWVALGTSFTLALRDLIETRELKIFDVGNVVLFGLLAIYAGILRPTLPISVTRLIVDFGMLFLLLLAIFRRDLKLGHGHGEAHHHHRWHLPLHILPRARQSVALVWALALGLSTAADAAVVFGLGVSASGAAAIGLLALAFALTFSLRYPQHIGQRAEAVRD